MAACIMLHPGPLRLVFGHERSHWHERYLIWSASGPCSTARCRTQLRFTSSDYAMLLNVVCAKTPSQMTAQPHGKCSHKYSSEDYTDSVARGRLPRISDDDASPLERCISPAHHVCVAKLHIVPLGDIITCTTTRRHMGADTAPDGTTTFTSGPAYSADL